MTRTERRLARRRRAIRRCVVTIFLAVAIMAAIIILTAGAAVTKAGTGAKRMSGGRDDVYLVRLTAEGDVKPEPPEIIVEGPKETEPTDVEDVNAELEIVEAEPKELWCLDQTIPLDYDLQYHLAVVCAEYEVPVEIALGCIEAESSFCETAENGNCYGYMQINSINLSQLESIGVTDLTDPYQNIRAGVYMLGDLYERYEDWDKALVCYNCGETGARENVFAYGCTSTSYSRNVLELAEKWAEVIADD